MYKLIVADDEPDVRDRILSMLKRLDTSLQIVGVFDNGYDALEGVSSLSPDVIITDIRMPYVNGIEVIKNAKLINPLIKSIIITGFDEFDYAKEAINLGVIDYISKPVTDKELKSALDKAKKLLDEENNVVQFTPDQKGPSFGVVEKENDLSRLMHLKELTPSFRQKIVHDGINIEENNTVVSIIDLEADEQNVA